MESKLIDDGYNIPVNTKLASVVGLKKSIILQQVFYWTELYKHSKDKKSHFRDGRWWVYNTMEEWDKQLSFVAKSRQLKTLFLELERDKLLLVGEYNQKGYDKTKWYSVDVDAVKTIVNTHCAKIAQCIGQELHNGECNNCTTNTIEYTNNTSKNEILVSNSGKPESEGSEPLIDKRYGIPENLGLMSEKEKEIWLDAIRYLIDRHDRWSKHKHRKHRPDYWRSHIEEARERFFFRRVEATNETLHRVIDYYYDKEHPKGNGEFAGLFNDKNLDGILNKLYGGSKADYYSAGMIRCEPELWEESDAKEEQDLIDMFV